MDTNNIKKGGQSSFSPVTKEDEKIFNKALSGLVGVKKGSYIAHEVITDNDRAVFEYVTKSVLGVDYELKAVATQVVNGINYKFICISKIVVPYAQPELTMIEAYTKFAHSVAPVIKINKITKM